MKWNLSRFSRGFSTKFPGFSGEISKNYSCIFMGIFSSIFRAVQAHQYLVKKAPCAPVTAMGNLLLNRFFNERVTSSGFCRGKENPGFSGS